MPMKAGLWRGLGVIARGANRVCVVDPDDPARCLKFLLPADERLPAGLRQRMRRRLAQHWPRLDENHMELRAWRRLYARLGPALHERVAACHGLVATPQGLALSAHCIRTGQGEPAPDLHHLLTHGGPYSAARLCAAVDDFEAWLLAHRVPLFDLNSGNLVVVERGGLPWLVCVDVKSVIGGKEPIPLSRWSRRLMARKIRRRAQRLRQRIRDEMPDASLAAPPSRH